MRRKSTRRRSRSRRIRAGGSGRQRRERRRGRGRIRSAGGRVARHLSPRAAEALGIGLIVLTILSVLGVWFHAGGPFGRFPTVVLTGLFGPIGYGAPVLFAYWAVLLIKGTVQEDRGRMLVGLAIGGLGVLGLASIGGTNPSPAAGFNEASGAGGAIGAAVAWPLSRVVSVYGAVVVCLGLLTLGTLVFTATSLAAVGRAVKRFVMGPDDATDPGMEAEGPRRGDRRPRLAREPSDEMVSIAPAMPIPEDEPVVLAGAKQNRLPLTSRANGYKLPPVEMLRHAPESKADGRDAQQTIAALERTFQNFGVAARVVSAHRGPTVTMYEVEVDAGTKVNRVLSLQDDIAYALATPDVRIVAPIPRKSAIGC